VAYQRIHRFTSVGRLPDTKQFPAKALLFLLPLCAALGAFFAWQADLPLLSVLQRALYTFLTVYGSWALARELVPDDSVAPFLSMTAGLFAVLVVASPGILVLFTTLLMVRMVNRSSGLAARKADSFVILILTLLVIYATDSPLYGLVAGLAFILDGILREPLRHQWLFGLVCFGGTIVYIIDHDATFSHFAAPASLFDWLALLFLLIFALNTLLLKSVKSMGDANGVVLDVGRVRGAMAVGFLCAAQGMSHPDSVVSIVAVIAGICFGMAFRKGFHAPAPA
jgi:hypothetical protein